MCTLQPKNFTFCGSEGVNKSEECGILNWIKICIPNSLSFIFKCRSFVAAMSNFDRF